jgi:guanylate kinase
MYGTSYAAVQEVLNEGKVCILDINVQVSDRELA